MPATKRKRRAQKGGEYTPYGSASVSTSWWDSLVKKSEGATGWFSDLMNKDISLSTSGQQQPSQPVSGTYYGGKRRRIRKKRHQTRKK